MGDGSKQDDVWPLPKFHFEVEIKDVGKIPFQEVSGLDTEAQVIEYRAGDSKTYSTIKMPGIMKFSNVTFKKGVFTKDNRFWDWYSKRNMNTFKRSPITISLLDENSKAQMVWTLQNAWPTKITSTDMKADANEVAVETLEVAHEGLTIATPG